MNLSMTLTPVAAEAVILSRRAGEARIFFARKKEQGG
jgi:hypothetical protein